MSDSYDGAVDVIVDARHLLCPMPVIKTQQAISHMKVGELVRVLCTDPGVEHDIPAWVRVHGHTVVYSNVGVVELGDEIEFIIKVQS